MRATKQAGLAFLFFAPVCAIAATNDPPMAISEYQKQEWHVEDGLSQNNVRAIIQAPNRQLLIGNSEGIASFDGIRFVPFRVGNTDENANEPVNALLISRSGDLWIGTDDRGVLRQRGQVTVNVSEEAGFHQERVRALFEDGSGAIWIATHNGVERVAGEKMQSLNELGLVPGDITEPFAQDSGGRVFIVTAKGLFLSDGAKTTTFLVAHKELDAVTAAYVDKNGIVWIGRSLGLSKFVPDGEAVFENLRCHWCTARSPQSSRTRTTTFGLERSRAGFVEWRRMVPSRTGLRTTACLTTPFGRFSKMTRVICGSEH